MIDASALTIPGLSCQQDCEIIDLALSALVLSDQARQGLMQRQNKAAGN